MLETMQRLANTLSQLLSPLCEVSIFKAATTTPIAVFNRLEAKITAPRVTNEPYFEHLGDGRQIKVMSFTFKDHNKTYVMQFRADVSIFAQLQSQLTTLLQQPTAPPSAVNWQQQIDHSVQQYLKKQQSSLSGLSRSQKRQLAYDLKQQGLLDYKEATRFLAKLLQTSRATIYNYLNWAEQITHITIHQVNSFSDKPGGGNPSGVVLDAKDLDQDTMRSIARELNYSETAFLLPSKKSDFRLRYFTRDGSEVAFCGHSTVGALFMLTKEQLFNITAAGDYTFQLETLADTIKVKIHVGRKNDIRVVFQTPTVKLQPSHLGHQIIADNMGFDVEMVDTQYPVMFEKTNRDLFMTIKSLKLLKNIQCDFRKLKHFMKQHNIIAICLLTSDTFDNKNDIHMRCFSPIVGVNEDPFTGSVLGGLAAYVHQQKIINPHKKHFNIEQGHFLNRPGEVTVHFQHHRGKYDVEVHAKARHFFSTEIELIQQTEELTS